MALKRPLALLNLSSQLRSSACIHCRNLHRLNAPAPRIPQPTPFVPDVQTFLTLIGRGLSQHAAKIPSWEALFSLSSQQLRESGIEPARARRYLLWWRERFQNGIVGIGGDMTNVKDGFGDLKIVEVPSDRPVDQIATPTKDAGMRKIIINTMPSDADAKEEDGEMVGAPPIEKIKATDAKPVMGMRIKSGLVISGRGVQLVKGHGVVARLKVQEGLWEQKRGRIIDGGERRRAEVRAKRRAQERKNTR